MQESSSPIRKITGKVQHYDWGGNVFIPSLTGIKTDGEPAAEYWLGTHPLAPAMVEADDSKLSLTDFLRNGNHSLPYLLKILDVKEMLSIQAHPDKATAEKGFAKENAAGIPADAPDRNYKDANHKPELMVALDDFWLLHGFRQEAEIIDMLSAFETFAPLVELLKHEGLQVLYAHVMSMKESDLDKTLTPVIEAIRLENLESGFDKSDTRYWIARAAARYASGTLDRGLFSIFLLNLVHLKPFQGVYQPAGVLHAYLEGQNVEIMSNSDNVLRGGLTSKHVDINELISIVHFDSIVPEIIEPDEKGCYKTGAPDFELYVYKSNTENTFTSRTSEIFIATDGNAVIKTNGHSSTIQKGESVLLLPGNQVLLTTNETGIIFRATIPA